MSKGTRGKEMEVLEDEIVTPLLTQQTQPSGPSHESGTFTMTSDDPFVAGSTSSTLAEGDAS